MFPVAVILYLDIWYLPMMLPTAGLSYYRKISQIMQFCEKTHDNKNLIPLSLTSQPLLLY